MLLHDAVRETIQAIRCKPGMNPVAVAADKLQVKEITVYKWMEDPESSGVRIPMDRARQLQSMSDSSALAEWLLAGSVFKVARRTSGNGNSNGSVLDEGIAVLEPAAEWLKIGKTPVVELSRNDRRRLRTVILMVRQRADEALDELKESEEN